MKRLLIAAALLSLTACETEPSGPLYPVARVSGTPRDAQGNAVLAGKPAPLPIGSTTGVPVVATATGAVVPAPPALRANGKPVSCKHFRRCRHKDRLLRAPGE